MAKRKRGRPKRMGGAVYVRLPDDILTKIGERCVVEDRDKSGVIRRIVVEYFRSAA